MSSESRHFDDMEDERHSIGQWLARHLLQERGRDRLAIFTVPAAVAPLETILELRPGESGVLWHPPSGPSWAATGVTAKIEVSGPTRLDQLRKGLQRIFANGVSYTYPGCDIILPRVFGGLSFAPGGNDTAPWTEFGDGRFALSRWTYTRTPRWATLSLATHLKNSDGWAAEAAILDEYEMFAAALDAHDHELTSAVHYRELAPVPEYAARQLDAATWRDYIDAIRRGIRENRFSKVVAARSCVVDLPQEVQDTTVLARLGVDFPETTRFAFRRRDSALIGATPEVLFRKNGLQVETEALAGTIRSLGSEFPRFSRQAVNLLNSNKDLSEHEVVVRDIGNTLGPLVEQLNVPDVPVVRKVRNIIHLNTPIQGTLRSGVDAVDLLAALHPTPAVGGLPREVARDFILQHEQCARGWYTGTVGWIDSAGDACFNVVIRSGVLEKGKRMHVFAGAGIVADSDADSEYAETALKQQPMLRAIGMGS